MERRHVIILGGGIAGLLLARQIAGAARRGECFVTLIDASHTLTYAAKIAAVAAGTLAPGAATLDLVAACARVGVAFVQGDILRIDAPRRKVDLGGGIHRTYDLLVCAMGVDRSAGAPPGAWVPTTPHEASQLHAALVTPAPDGHTRDVLVLGDGVAAIRMACAIAMRRTRDGATVHLATASARVLPDASEEPRLQAETMLAHAGVRVHRRTVGTDVDMASRFGLRDPVVIALRHGAPRGPRDGWPWPTNRDGTLIVAATGEVRGAEGVWALPPTLGGDELRPVTRVLARNLRRAFVANGAARAGAPLPAPADVTG